MEENALWHKVTEQEKKEIQENAKKIMDEFASKLEKVTVSEEHFSVNDGLRSEGEPWKTNEEFRSTMFSNAPNVEDDAIVAEKGAWK